jgi:hypothetical protein
MALKFADEVKNPMLDGFESGVGTAPTLEIWSGTEPADTSAADAGDGAVLASMTLPSDFMGNAAAGVKALAGVWQDLSADATGTATHFRMKQGASVRVQGNVGTSGADMNLSSVSLTAGQSVTINTFTLNMNNN